MCEPGNRGVHVPERDSTSDSWKSVGNLEVAVEANTGVFSISHPGRCRLGSKNLEHWMIAIENLVEHRSLERIEWFGHPTL